MNQVSDQIPDPSESSHIAQQVDKLLINAIVLTMDNNYTRYEPGGIAIAGDSILDVGMESKLRQAYRADETVDAPRKGLIKRMFGG